jgi:hypothetical protein
MPLIPQALLPSDALRGDFHNAAKDELVRKNLL